MIRFFAQVCILGCLIGLLGNGVVLRNEYSAPIEFESRKFITQAVVMSQINRSKRKVV